MTLDNQLMVSLHNKNYWISCNLYGHGLYWGTEDQDRRVKDIIDFSLLLCPPSYQHVARYPWCWYRGLYPTINPDGNGSTQQMYYLLDIAIHVELRVQNIRVNTLFEVNSKWLGKMGTNNKKSGMETKSTLLYNAAILLTEGQKWKTNSGDLCISYFIHISLGNEINLSGAQNNICLKLNSVEHRHT